MHKGQVLSEEHKAKLLKANKGKVLSEETKAKIGLANKGRIPSEETRAKIRLANKGAFKRVSLSIPISQFGQNIIRGNNS